MFFLSSRTSPRVLFQEFKRFRREIREFNPRIVHAHYGTVTALFCALATMRPLVISFRGSDLNPASDCSYSRSLMARLFSQLAVLRAKHVICVSEQLKARIWLRSWPVSIIFDGVDLSNFRPIPREEARRKLGWNHDDNRVFFNLGGRPSGKRLALAQSAVAFARTEFPGLELVTATEIDPELIPFYLNACDCLLLTSKSEGSPTVVKEAIACNLPVVTVDVGDVKSLLNGVEPTRIVEAETAALGNALVEILRLKTRSNGWVRAEDLSERRTTDRVVEVLKGVTAARDGSERTSAAAQ
jgi:glycosyltransferase involved in cell wall biosynthesis